MKTINRLAAGMVALAGIFGTAGDADAAQKSKAHVEAAGKNEYGVPHKIQSSYLKNHLNRALRETGCVITRDAGVTGDARHKAVGLSRHNDNNAIDIKELKCDGDAYSPGGSKENRRKFAEQNDANLVSLFWRLGGPFNLGLTNIYKDHNFMIEGRGDHGEHLHVGLKEKPVWKHALEKLGF